MAADVWADPGFARELRRLSAAQQAAVQTALPGLAAALLDHPQVALIHGSRYQGSFRLRIGQVRVLGLALVHANLVLLTAAFVNRRPSDYDEALARHEKRLATQGPPLDGSVKGARRR